jgi:hypothetical protein
MVKIKVAQDEIENIKEKIRDKGWTVDRNTTEVLPEANKDQFKKILKQKNINCESTIQISDLKELCKSKIFTSESENKLRDYIDKNNGKIEIVIQDFYIFFDTSEIRIKSFTHRSYMNFLNRKEIEKEVFLSFCKVIGINWKSVVDKDSIYYQSHSLLDSLVSFNHNEQINSFKHGLHTNQIFGVTHSCSYSRIWTLRRLEYEINRITLQKSKRIVITGSRYAKLDIDSMNNKFSDKNLNCLTKENVLIFFDLQDFVLENIENVVSSYWNNLITKVPQNTKGKLIMFLSNTNYDQEQIQQSLNTINIPTSSLFRLPTINDELASLLAEIYIRYNNKLEQNQDLMEISRNIIINSQNDAGNLLKNIYDKFLDNEQTQKELSLWQKYP